MMVLPAGAGVILNTCSNTIIRLSAPRRCGGDPLELNPLGLSYWCSPQVRG